MGNALRTGTRSQGGPWTLEYPFGPRYEIDNPHGRAARPGTLPGHHLSFQPRNALLVTRLTEFTLNRAVVPGCHRVELQNKLVSAQGSLTWVDMTVETGTRASTHWEKQGVETPPAMSPPWSGKTEKNETKNTETLSLLSNF